MLTEEVTSELDVPFATLNTLSDISETIILAAAQQLVSLGLKAAGYQYVNIDVS